MRRETVGTGTRRGLPVVVLMVFKLLQFVLLLGVLAVLVFGVLETAMSVLHHTRGVAVEGKVTDVYQVDPGRRSSTFDRQAQGFRFPTISYTWPPEGGHSQWFRSMIPREDVGLGDAVTVRVIPGYENLARADRSAGYYVLVGIALIGGIAFTWILFSTWYMVDAANGRGPAGGISIFHGFAGKAMLTAIIGPAVAILLLHFYFVPWMQVNEYVAFADRPGRLLYLAAERGGPPVDGPLNAYERRLLTIPGLRIGISQDALNRAFSTRDTETLLRYIDAIKDPDIAFSVDRRRAPYSAVTGPPDILRRFLESGVELSEEARASMLEEAERRNDADKLAILAEFGITADALGR